MANDESQKGFDLLRKLISAGIGAAFMTEESIRAYLGELKLPKDVVGLLLQGAQKSKDELMDRVGNEVIKIIQKIDFVNEASRFVEEHKFRITAEVDVVKKESVRKDSAQREGTFAHAESTTRVESGAHPDHSKTDAHKADHQKADRSKR